MKYFFLSFFLCLNSYAFWLNNSVGARFANSHVKIRVASNTGTCSNANTTAEELSSLIAPAVDRYWNTVPTSRLRLSSGGYYQTDNSDFSDGVLCFRGNTECEANAIIVPPASGIVIACNSETSENFTSSGILALTLPNFITGRDIHSAVILINDAAGSSFANLNRDQKIAVMAHEIGHAIGIGHSEDRAAMMFASVVPKRRSLGNDDIKAVTYLYPQQYDACGLFTGSLSDTQPPAGHLILMLLGFIFALIATKLLAKKFPAFHTLFHKHKDTLSLQR